MFENRSQFGVCEWFNSRTISHFLFRWLFISLENLLCIFSSAHRGVIQFWQLALSFFDQTDRASSLHINRELGSSKSFGSHDKIVFMCQFATSANESMIVVIIIYRCHAMLLLVYDQKAMKIKSKSGKVL